MYSTGIYFLHQTTGRLPVRGCTNTVETPMDYMSKNMPSTSMTHVACESKLRSVVTSSMHPWPGNCWQSGVRPRIMPGMPMRLVQKLNVDIVCVFVDYSSRYKKG